MSEPKKSDKSKGPKRRSSIHLMLKQLSNIKKPKASEESSSKFKSGQTGLRGVTPLEEMLMDHQSKVGHDSSDEDGP